MHRFIFIVLIAAGAGYWFRLERPTAYNSGRAAMVPVPAAPLPAAKEPDQEAAQPEPEQWKHGGARDDLDGTEQRFATLRSTNLVEFPFPYNGPQHGTLRVSEEKPGLFILSLHLERGQFIGDWKSYGIVCPLRVRFDEGPVQNFTMLRFDDQTNAAWTGQSELIAQLQTAKRVRIQAHYFEAANVTLDFHWDEFPF